METEDTRKVDERFMRRALQLARGGWEHAAPNPMVGAVVVCDGRIVGEGFHRKCGQPHAEVNAIARVADPALLRRSTIYVTLEPCAHYGKTPPCAKLIVDKQIPRVVVGCRDSFEKVNGRGIGMLREAGRQVTVGVLEEECLDLNRAFFVYHREGRPFVMLKWAESADGFVDICRCSADVPSAVLSSATTQTLVHRLRSHADAILVGGRTAVLDNPSLTTRCWSGPDPLRVVLDGRGSLPTTLRMLNDGLPVKVYDMRSTDLPGVLADLARLGVQSLLVEGGPATTRRFMEAGLWDDLCVEHSPLVLGGGVAAPAVTGARLMGSVWVDGHRIDRYRRLQV